MGHTNQTANYNLPQFVGTDKPSWLGDFNDAFAAIDTAIAAAASEASTADGKADALGTTVSGHTTQIGTLQNTVTTQGNTLNTVTSLIGNGTPTTTDHTIIGAINELHADQGDLANLTTTDKSSLVAAINEAAQGGSSAASAVSYDNTVSGLAATNVQAAIDEVVADASKNERGTVYDFSSHTTSSNAYTLPADGYIKAYADGTLARITVLDPNDVELIDGGATHQYDSAYFFVRKGMKVYVRDSQGSGNTFTFIPLV